MTIPIDQRKNELRGAMRKRLAALTAEDRHAASAAACQRVAGLDAFRHAAVVMLYLPLPSELDLTPLAIACFRAGKSVCVPCVDWQRKEMRPVEITSFDASTIERDDYGAPCPRERRPVLTSAIDLVIVPGLAFDAAGGRLGRGGGFYDRFLAKLHHDVTTVGMGFDSQVVDTVPTSAADQAVDMVVTERRVSQAKPSTLPGRPEERCS